MECASTLRLLQVSKYIASMSTTTDRAYPVQVAEDEGDPRFNLGLLLDVKDVLEAAGYPELDDLDVVDLRSALFRFLYKGDRR